ncbi:nuclear transport factor 2 family protein [Ruegeria arenilitoris]|uniref:nuclear transport factor 2 family protein n=1 Tax=Ruegeria arenilitoris TaxID=1173585 RepID=UPI0014799DD2|nr:nuclear transport factor 2 family protein [Ruegeria arenilitoris]
MADMIPSDTFQGISQAITDIAAGADRHDWTRVRTAFADTVTTDYTGLWGGDPVTQSADKLIASWAAFLPGFEITHHMVTNHTVTELANTAAKAEADFTATHRINDEFWVLGGRYSYDLVKDGADWKVTSVTMTPLWETGDRALVAQAGERAAEKK